MTRRVYFAVPSTISLLTMQDLADRWQCHERTVRNEIHRGDLPATKVAGMWRIKPQDADAYLAARAGQQERPAGWREAICAALRAAPEPTPELCEQVAGLLGAAIGGDKPMR